MSNIALQPRVERRWHKTGLDCWCIVYGDRVIGFGTEADGGKSCAERALADTGYNWSTAFNADTTGYWSLTEAPDPIRDALENLIEAIPRQTNDQDWWPDELTAAVFAAKKALER